MCSLTVEVVREISVGVMAVVTWGGIMWAAAKFVKWAFSD